MTTTFTTEATHTLVPATSTTLNVGVVQMNSSTSTWRANIDDAGAHVRTLAAGGTRIVVLPELFASGYDLATNLHAIAETVPGPTSDALSALALETDTVIVTAIVTRDDNGSLFDSSLVVGPAGVLGLGHKRFLWAGENEVFTPGASSGLVVDTPFGTVGVVICYEAGFPEAVRDLAVRGADLITVPSAFGQVRLHVWKLLTRSRALENGVVVAAADLTGPNGTGGRFAGHSVIVDPLGRVLVEMTESTGAVSAVVERTSLTDARDALPYRKDLARLGGITDNHRKGI